MAMADYGTGNDALKNISENGQVPECRLGTAESIRNRFQRFLDSDDKRSRKRAKVDGLVDGNPPYNPSKLKEAGRADAANFNDGTARAFLESAIGAFYDLVSEGPGHVNILQHFGDEEKQIEYGRTMSSEADLIFDRDKSWDRNIQTSQHSTVLHGAGPLFFDDPHVVFPRPIRCRDLLVPDLVEADLDRWEISIIPFEYYPPEMYERIQNPKAAKAIGWDVEHTRKVIQHAIPQKEPNDRQQDWEYYQNLIKTNSFDYIDSENVCKLAHGFGREFNGRITHVIIERSDTTGLGTKFLFKSVGRYANFYQIVHPMYYDTGREGLHHNVTGLGVKMYTLMEYLMRGHCNLWDKSFAPKTLFMPTTAEAASKFQMQRYSDYALMTPGVNVVQAPIQGYLTDGLAMYRNSSEVMRSNLSQYRQQVPMEKPGNPATAFEKRLDASTQSSLSNTTFSRYYEQLDLLYAEIVRRLCNLNSTDPRAISFQKRCKEKGVPKECFGCVDHVTAVRVLGGGTPFMRQTTTQTMMGILQRLPEDGQQNLLNDFIASHAGPTAVQRWSPKSQTSIMMGDQRERAGNQITGMKAGKQYDFSPSQDALIFASVFLHACVQSLGSVQKGADPKSVLSFLDLCAPACRFNINRMLKDPLRKAAGETLEKQLEQVAKQTDQLTKMLQKQAQQTKKQQGKTQQVLSDIQLKNVETQAKIKDRAIKTRAQLTERAQKHRQNLALNDLRTSAEVSLNRFRALSE